MLPWWSPTPRTSNSFSTVAWCRSCSSRSWFCRFHFVLWQKIIFFTRHWTILIIMLFNELSKETMTFYSDTKFWLGSRRVIARRRRRCDPRRSDIFDNEIFAPDKQAERGWRPFVFFWAFYRLADHLSYHKTCQKLLVPGMATELEEDFLIEYMDCFQDRSCLRNRNERPNHPPNLLKWHIFVRAQYE